MPAKKKDPQKTSSEEAAQLQTQNSKPETLPDYFDSIAQAAAALKIPKSKLQLWKRQGCPGFKGSRVYRAEIQLWAQDSGETPNSKAKTSHSSVDDDLDKTVWAARREKQHCEREAWEFSRDRGEYKKKSDFAADLIQLGSEQKALLRQKLENEYPGLCPGLEPKQRAALKKLGRELIDELCKRHQRLVDKWT